MDLYSFFQGVISGVRATSLVEWIAVLTSLMYVVLAARKSIWCWFFAFIGSSLYVYLCIAAKLYLESALQVFYVIMAVVGWRAWVSTRSKKLDIQLWSLGQHGLNILLSGIMAFVLGWLFDQYTDQQNPYADAFTTVYSLAATFMVARKVLENWIYWLIIDGVSIWLYAQRGLDLTSFLFVLYILLAVVGFVSWNKEYRKQRA